MKTKEHVCSTRREWPVLSISSVHTFIFLLAFFPRVLLASEVPVDSNAGSKVIYLTDATFEDYDEGFLLVLYYAQWSGQSRRMFPVWSQLAEEVHAAGLSITVAMIDSQEYRMNPGSSHVHTLPTIFLFHNLELLARFVMESTVKDLKAAVFKFIDLSSGELAHQKTLIHKELDEAKLKQEEKKNDIEKQETQSSLEFESDVPTLHRDNFLAITADKYALVMVYTQWCEHCKLFKADWLSLSRDPQIHGLLVAKINLDSFKSFRGARLVDGVPTILFLNNSVVLGKYDGVQTLEGVRLWANQMTKFSAEEVHEALASIQARELQFEADAQQRAVENEVQSIRMNEDFENIKELTNDNFAEETQGKSALILFYTDRGQRSLMMKPVWVALSKLQDLSGLLIARFPEQDNRWSAELEFVHGYPTVLVARSGVIIERYEGVQSVDELHHYAQTLLELSDEESQNKHHRLVQIMQRENMAEVEKERALAKAEQKRKEEAIRKSKQLKRKQKPRYASQK